MTLGRMLALAMGSLAVAVLAGLWWLSAGLLRDQAEEQALARVRVAGLAARDQIRRYSEDGLVAARLLASRPTLKRLVLEGRPEPLVPFLQRFCATSALDSCAVLYRAQPIAASGLNLPLAAILAAADEQGERVLLADPAAPDGLIGSVVAVPDLPDVRVIVARMLDDRLERAIRTETGEDVRLLQLTNWIDTVDEPMRELHSAALTDGEFNARRIDSLDVYAASVPVLASTGEGVALIEVRLPGRRRGELCRALPASPRADRARRGLTGGAGGRPAGPAHRTTPARHHAIRSAARTRRFLGIDPGRRQPRDAGARADHGDHAPQPDRAHDGAAPARSGGASRTHGRGRGSVRGRCRAHHPLRQSAGCPDARCRARRGRRPVLRRRAATDRTGRQASLRDGLPDPPGARGRLGPGDRGARARRRVPAYRRDHQRRVGRWPAGAGHEGRDRARSRSACARLRAGEHRTRIPYTAGRAARIDRAAAGRAGADVPGGTSVAGGLAAARHAAADAADRQPARERAHRVRPALHPAPIGVAVAGRRGCGRDARRPFHAAETDARRRVCRPTCRWWKAMHRG